MGPWHFSGRGALDDDVVAPTLDDPVVRAASGGVGGPLGRHALPGRGWWTALRVTLAVATITFGLGVVQKGGCVVDAWGDIPAPFSFSHMCYSDIQYLYVGRGLAEGIFPYEPLDELPPRRPLPTHRRRTSSPSSTRSSAVSGWVRPRLSPMRSAKSPDLSSVPHSSVSSDLRAQHDSAIFWGVNAVGFFAVLLIGLALLVRAQRRRPVGCHVRGGFTVAGVRRDDQLGSRRVRRSSPHSSGPGPPVDRSSAGIFIGLGVATKLYPLFFLGPLLVLVPARAPARRPGSKTVAAAVAPGWSSTCRSICGRRTPSLVLGVQLLARTGLRVDLAGGQQLRARRRRRTSST